MASVGYATLSVIPSAKNFGRQLASEVDPQLDATGRTSGARFGRVLGGAAVAAAGIALAGISAVLRTGVQEALDASGGIAQLEAGIKSTGGAAGVTVEHLTDMAGSLQLMSGQTDDSIVAAQQLLLTFTNIRNTGTAKIFDEATLATTNMAAKMGGDASSNALLLGKALNDPIAGLGALVRAGVQFTDGQKATIESMVAAGDMAGAQSLILAELNTQFGGAAEAAGKSLPGQLEIAKRKFEDISQTIAEQLLPVVLPALQSIADVITGRVLPAVSRFIADFQSGVGPAGVLKDALGTLRDAMSTVWDKVQEFDFSGLWDQFSEGAQDVLPALSIAGDVLGDVFGFIADHADLIAKALPFLIAGFIAVKGAQLLNNLVGRDSVIGFGLQLVSTASLTASNYALAASQKQVAASTALATTADKASLSSRLKSVVATGSQTLALIASKVATIASTVAAGIATAAQWLWNAALTANPIGIVVVAIGALVAAVLWAYNNVDWFKTGIDALGQAFVWLWDKILKPYIDAFVTTWSWMWSNVIKPVVEFIIAYFKLMGDTYLWVWDNVLYPTIQALASAFTWVKDRIGENFALVRAIISGAADFIQDRWDKTIAFFREAPGKIGGFFSKIGDTITNVFKGAFNGVARMWNDSVGKLSFTIPDIVGVPNRGETFSFPKIPMLAEGGIVTKPTLAMVGEGPESEAVIPLSKLDAMLSGRGGGKGQTIHIHGIQNVDQIAAELPRIQYRGAA